MQEQVTAKPSQPAAPVSDGSERQALVRDQGADSSATGDGRPCEVSLRRVLDGVLYVARVAAIAETSFPALRNGVRLFPALERCRRLAEPARDAAGAGAPKGRTQQAPNRCKHGQLKRQDHRHRRAQKVRRGQADSRPQAPHFSGHSGTCDSCCRDAGCLRARQAGRQAAAGESDGLV